MGHAPESGGGGFIRRKANRGKRFFKNDSRPSSSGDRKTAAATPSGDQEPPTQQTIRSPQPAASYAGGQSSGGSRGGNGALIAFAVSAGFIVLIALAAYLYVKSCSYCHQRGELAYKEEIAKLIDTNAPVVTDRVETETLSTVPWVQNVEPGFVADRKIRGIAIDSTAIDHLNLGIYEASQMNNRAEGALHLFLSSIRGNRRAAVLLLDDRIYLGDREESIIEDLHELNGGRGMLYLAQYYAYGKMIPVTEATPPDPRIAEKTLVDASDPVFNSSPAKAYRYFHIASLCGVPNAYQYRNQMVLSGWLSENAQEAQRQQAEEMLDALVRRSGGERETFCTGEFLEHRLARLTPAMVLTDGRLLSMEQLVQLLWQPAADFDAFVAAAPGAGNDGYSRWAPGARTASLQPAGPGRSVQSAGGAGDGGSKFYRDNPGGGVATPGTGYDGLPDECRIADPPSDCAQRLEALQCSDESRYYFSLGDAEMARGALVSARDYFSRSISVGRICGSEYAVQASKRLGALNLTCEYTPDSLRRIARGASTNPEGGEIIDLRIRQRALRALGHYRGNIDGSYGPQTRDAISRFQREFGFRETGDMTPIETVYAVCGAAEIARDIDSYTALGLMYVTGLGVVQNTDLGLQWLKQAARDGDEDALYNLALLYGSGTVLSSFVICDVVENQAQADAYLEEAARAGHPAAVRLVERYGALSSDRRWKEIRAQLGTVASPPGATTGETDDSNGGETLFEKRLEQVGVGCQANPAAPVPDIP